MFSAPSGRSATLLLSVCTVDKSKVEISQNFVDFSEYMNFMNKSPIGSGKSNVSLVHAMLLEMNGEKY